MIEFGGSVYSNLVNQVKKLEDGLSSVVSKLIERCYISQNEREYYKNIRLEESKLGANKVKLARKQYRGKGRYIDEILV